MAQGDILKTTGLIVETMPVKTGTTIVKGTLVCDDGAGIVPATAALAAVTRCYMAIEGSVAADPATVECVVYGCVEVAKVSAAGAARKGQKLMVSATAGAVTKFTPGDVTATVSEATVEAANLVNLGVVGEAYESSVAGDATQKMWLGG